MKRTRSLSDLAAASLLLAVGAAFAAAMLFLGGCAFQEEEDGEPVPQQESSIDLEPQEGGVPRTGDLLEDFGPSAETAAAAASGTPRTAFRYDRRRAKAYIDRYAMSPNRRYAYCADWGWVNGALVKTPADCTNFASQVLNYGGVPQRRTGSTGSGWWYVWSCNDSGGSSRSWRTVNGLINYLVWESGVAEFRQRARDLQVGDLIIYRLRREEDGYACDGSLFNHATVVSGFDADGEPLVSYHSNEAHRVRWNARNGTLKSLGEACLTAFVHIKG